ncbi:holo-ACP synthase [Vibrio sp.]|nr:holo-ACP synthase [Vibrio sp.]
MSILGLGTDISEIARVDAVLKRLGDAFAHRILVANEMERFHATKQPERYLAKRFAAKEAASKALGTGIAKGVSFHDFEISNDSNGKPLLHLSGEAKKRAQDLGVMQYHLSISDETHYAVATVILES